MASPLQNMTIAILATDGVEQTELKQTRQKLTDAGADVHLVALGTGPIQARHDDPESGVSIMADVAIDQVTPTDYHGLLLPGGKSHPDKLRTNRRTIGFVRGFFQQYKPVAAIGYAPGLLVDAAVLKGRRVTSHHSLRSDLEHAGAIWVDREVVNDPGLITSRTMDDLNAFCNTAIHAFAQGKHDAQRVKPGPAM